MTTGETADALGDTDVVKSSKEHGDLLGDLRCVALAEAAAVAGRQRHQNCGLAGSRRLSPPRMARGQVVWSAGILSVAEPVLEKTGGWARDRHLGTEVAATSPPDCFAGDGAQRTANEPPVMMRTIRSVPAQVAKPKSVATASNWENDVSVSAAMIVLSAAHLSMPF